LQTGAPLSSLAVQYGQRFSDALEVASILPTSPFSRARARCNARFSSIDSHIAGSAGMAHAYSSGFLRRILPIAGPRALG
jgi:hypothetical protein